jgi:hypothetical protein
MPFPKNRLHRIASAGRLRCRQGFVPPKIDTLKTAPMRLNGQNRFRACFLGANWDQFWAYALAFCVLDF